MPSPDPFTCWVVTDGKAGMESQCIGLAEALGANPVVKRVRLRAPWRFLTPYVRCGGQMQFATGSDSLGPPWPDLLIATGRHSVAASLLVRRLSARKGKRTITVQLQNPVIDPHHFDLVAVPRHDALSGPNVVATWGALHRVTADVLREGAARFAPRVAHLSRPYVCALIGGTNAAYRLGPSEMASLARQLVSCTQTLQGSLLVTSSRRTGAQNLRVLEEALTQVPHLLWDGKSENPYFGMLGLADFIVVTCDSVNMVSEAASTGKPVYIANLPGGSAKFERFHKALYSKGVTRPFSGRLEAYSYPPLNDVGMVAERVRALLRKV